MGGQIMTLKDLLEMRDQRDNSIDQQKAKIKVVEGQLETNEAKIRAINKHSEKLKESLKMMQPKLERLQAERGELSHQIETWTGE